MTTIIAANICFIGSLCAWLLQSIEYTFGTCRSVRVSDRRTMTHVAACRASASFQIMHRGIRPLIAIHAIQIGEI